MCEHCGCRGVEPIAELMDEHLELLDQADAVTRLLASGDKQAAWARLADLAALLDRHVRREEAGIFTAVKEQGDFADAVVDLETEHSAFDEAISDLDLGSPHLAEAVASLFRDLSEHIDKENLGIFPVAVVTLTAAGWNTVVEAHEQLPAL